MSPPGLSIIIPAFNEAQRLPATIEAIRRWMDAWPREVELVLVDDGSTDGTERLVLEQAAADERVRPIRLAFNRGKGAAVRNGFAVSRGEHCVFFDADLAYPLTAIDEAMARLSHADLVVGCRDLVPAAGRMAARPLRRAVSALFGFLVENVFHLQLRDTQCGFKAFRGPIARQLFPLLTVDGFGFDVELLFLARLWGLRIEQMPIVMRHVDGSSVRIPTHGLQMTRDLLRILRNARRGGYTRPTELGLCAATQGRVAP